MLEGARSEQVLRLARQVNAVSYTSAREYAGRSLFELLQNGYDAHPRDRRDGRVHVLLDEAEGEWGTLYVANGGNPFTWQNVKQICELAQSSKDVGEGIGNKGVGFRSILLISDAPEIYSADPDSPFGPEMDGYCFRFAEKADMEEFLAGEDNAHEVATKYPPLQAPLPLDDVPATCRQLAAQGYVTIVRLPLLNEAARAEVQLRMDELGEAKVPVMLFLDRLAGLTLERRAYGSETGELDGRHEAYERHELTRSEERLAVPQDGAGHGSAISFATVDLGPSGTFLVARGTVEKERLNSTLAKAVSSGLLDDTWQEWKRSAVVEVALPLPALRRPRRGQTYTFLPMGENLAAPFPGHMNAPFFTKFDRTGLPPDHPLNVLLLDAVAETQEGPMLGQKTTGGWLVRQHQYLRTVLANGDQAGQTVHRAGPVVVVWSGGVPHHDPGLRTPTPCSQRGDRDGDQRPAHRLHPARGGAGRMGFGKRRNAHDISVPSPADNAYGGDWHQGKSDPGSAAPAVTGQPLEGVSRGGSAIRLRS
ncbi:sacsin N-terminal ATP-binding-like domain-containing protein [Streptomyces cyaneofuscatus]|uniref:sacsin N-terminal ATP-binding-like domain-containing protein n=1 Tax=Streptomyces cyaneofuscatus TaxID=66883 RepID=UPI003F5406F5